MTAPTAITVAPANASSVRARFQQRNARATSSVAASAFQLLTPQKQDSPASRRRRAPPSPGDRSLAMLAALVMVSGLVPVASIYVTRGVVDRLVAAISAPAPRAAVATHSVGVGRGVLLLASEVICGVLSWVRSRHQERLQDHITARIHEQSARLDLAFYELPAFFDRLHRAREVSQPPAEAAPRVRGRAAGWSLVGLAAALVAFGCGCWSCSWSACCWCSTW